MDLLRFVDPHGCLTLLVDRAKNADVVYQIMLMDTSRRKLLYVCDKDDERIDYVMVYS